MARTVLAPQRNPLSPLLATKLHAPRPRIHLVPRAHLVKHLERGAESALTLVSAPAGFGKSTLLAQWVAESAMPVAWLSLEAEDNDPTRFLAYLIAALQALDAEVGTTALEMLPAGTSNAQTNQDRNAIAAVWVADARFTLDQLTKLNSDDKLLIRGGI